MAKVTQITVNTLDVDILSSYAPVVRLGIQAEPGATFKINSGNDIVMGGYGIYELDLTGLEGYISSLIFQDLKGRSAFVDIVYEGSGTK